MTSIYGPKLFSKLSSEWYLATSLYDAIEDGNMRQVAILLQEKHADPNVIVPDYDITPFHLAVGHENIQFAKDVTKILLKNGADPNVKDNDGVTPLHVAAVWNRPSIVRLLLSYGGDPLIVDDTEKNAFHYAYEEHAWETLRTLEIYRRVGLSNQANKENNKNYNIRLEKVIVEGNGVQAEYRLLCDGCKNDIKETKSVGTQTPLCRIQVPTPSETDLETFLDMETTSLRICSTNDWCKEALSQDIVITEECKRKITSHRTRSKTYEYNPIFKHSSQITHNSLDNKALANSENLENSALDDEMMKDLLNKISPKSQDSAKNSTETKDTDLKNGENFSEDSLTSEAKKSLIPFIDESESSQNCDKSKGIDDNDVLEVEVSGPGETDPKETNKHVSWSGCLSTCACIPKHINESDSSVYYTTNAESDGDEKKIGSFSMTGIEELSPEKNDVKIQPEDSLKAESFSIPGIKELSAEENYDKNQAEDSFENISLPKTNLNISIEYKYTDDEDGIEFVEAKMPLCISSTNNSDRETPVSEKRVVIGTRKDESETSDCTAYDTDYIRSELKKLGFVSGPMAGNTKKLYLRKLKRIRKTMPIREGQYLLPNFSPELEQVLRVDDDNWVKTLSEWTTLETEIIEHFADDSFSSSWRSGTAKTSFTYLLLDPRISKNLPARCEQMDLIDVWRDFVNAVFYVGKGTRARPYEHLHEAFLVWKETKAYPRRRCSLKVRHILEIWNEGLGVVCLQIFHNVIPAEALTREAAMIDTIGLPRLKNEKGGVYYGKVASWNSKLKRRLGACLLYRAMRMFIADNEVQLKPTDVR